MVEGVISILCWLLSCQITLLLQQLGENSRCCYSTLWVTHKMWSFQTHFDTGFRALHPCCRQCHTQGSKPRAHSNFVRTQPLMYFPHCINCTWRFETRSLGRSWHWHSNWHCDIFLGTPPIWAWYGFLHCLAFVCAFLDWNNEFSFLNEAVELCLHLWLESL